LGEYDALPGLSQKMSTAKEPVEQGGAGHGCGHNLFGTACLGAVTALKEAIQLEHIPGTIRFYGCPAEETLRARLSGARSAFGNLDAAISWHPGDQHCLAGPPGDESFCPFLGLLPMPVAHHTWGAVR
jgi:aminobenzoyl-glutamate utilization protein B